jgi:hypothetical protein
MKCYIYFNSFSLLNASLSFGMGLRLVKLFSCFKLWNVLVFYVGYISVTKCYLIVEKLGIQIIHKTIQIARFSKVSRQLEVVSGQQSQ